MKKHWKTPNLRLFFKMSPTDLVLSKVTFLTNFHVFPCFSVRKCLSPSGSPARSDTVLSDRDQKPEKTAVLAWKPGKTAVLAWKPGKTAVLTVPDPLQWELQCIWLYRTLYSGNYSVFGCTGRTRTHTTVGYTRTAPPHTRVPHPRLTSWLHRRTAVHGGLHGFTRLLLETKARPTYRSVQKPENPEMWLFWRNVAVLTKLGLVLRQFWRKWLKLVVFSGFWRKTLKSVVS